MLAKEIKNSINMNVQKNVTYGRVWIKIGSVLHISNMSPDRTKEISLVLTACNIVARITISPIAIQWKLAIYVYDACIRHLHSNVGST